MLQNKGDTGQMMLKNYAADSRHLILLNNIPIEGENCYMSSCAGTYVNPVEGEGVTAYTF
jgi:hypothetical protein